MLKSHFLLYFRHFLSDFENNGTFEISEFFCVGLAIENKFFDWNLFGVWWSLIGVPLFVGVDYPKRHIYDISTNNPCFLCANLVFCVGCSRPTKHPPQKSWKSPFFYPPLLREKTGIFDDGHKLAVGSRDLTPKSAVFSIRRGSNGLATYEQTKKSRKAAWRRHARYRRPNFLVGFLCDVVSSCQVWFESVQFCPRYGGKPSRRRLE